MIKTSLFIKKLPTVLNSLNQTEPLFSEQNTFLGNGVENSVNKKFLHIESLSGYPNNGYQENLIQKVKNTLSKNTNITFLIDLVKEENSDKLNLFIEQHRKFLKDYSFLQKIRFLKLRALLFYCFNEQQYLQNRNEEDPLVTVSPFAFNQPPSTNDYSLDNGLAFANSFYLQYLLLTRESKTKLPLSEMFQKSEIAFKFFFGERMNPKNFLNLFLEEFKSKYKNHSTVEMIKDEEFKKILNVPLELDFVLESSITNPKIKEVLDNIQPDFSIVFSIDKKAIQWDIDKMEISNFKRSLAYNFLNENSENLVDSLGDTIDIINTPINHILGFKDGYLFIKAEQFNGNFTAFPTQTFNDFKARKPLPKIQNAFINGLYNEDLRQKSSHSFWFLSRFAPLNLLNPFFYKRVKRDFNHYQLGLKIHEITLISLDIILLKMFNIIHKKHLSYLSNLILYEMNIESIKDFDKHNFVTCKENKKLVHLLQERVKILTNELNQYDLIL